MHFGDLFSKNSEYLFTVWSFVEEVMDFVNPVTTKCMKGSVQLGHHQLCLKFKQKKNKAFVFPVLSTFNLDLSCQIPVN